MADPFSRLSLAVGSIIAAALLFGFLAGGIVIHRFETASQTSQTSTTQREEQAQPEKDNQQADKNDTGDQPNKNNPNPPKSENASGARTSEPDGND